MLNKIFSIDSAKAIKAQSFGYLNAIHYMAPASMSGVNLCPHASPACIAACLGWTSGQAGMVANDADLNSVRKSRIQKAKRFMSDRQAYLDDVIKSIHKAQAQARKLGMKLCIRLNGSTDISWEGIRLNNGSGLNLFQLFPEVQFVDYTKSKRRALAHARGFLPKNYHLTFSRSEVNEADCLDVLSEGGNVAVVFAVKPETFKGSPVVDGDTHDLRHLDPKGGYVIALSPKGLKAKKETSGFVVR